MSYNYQDAPRESQQEYFGKVNTDNKETLYNALKRIEELEKENTELKEELKNWKDEWQEQVQKAIDEGYARTQQTIQLAKAKELLAKWVELYNPKSETVLPTPIQVKTEQFLKQE